MKLEELLKKENLDLKDVENAFIHSSYANLHKLKSNERLEFLGDSLLNLFTTIILFESDKSKNEGELSKIRSGYVSTKNLCKIYDLFNLNLYLKIAHKPSEKIKANTIEAIVGCVFLKLKEDYLKTREFVKNFVFINTKMLETDFKSILQEKLQSKESFKIEYETKQKENLFLSIVKNNGVVLASGSGRTKKEAEQNSAKNALDLFA